MIWNHNLEKQTRPQNPWSCSSPSGIGKLKSAILQAYQGISAPTPHHGGREASRLHWSWAMAEEAWDRFSPMAAVWAPEVREGCSWLNHHSMLSTSTRGGRGWKHLPLRPILTYPQGFHPTGTSRTHARRHSCLCYSGHIATQRKAAFLGKVQGEQGEELYQSERASPDTSTDRRALDIFVPF